MIRVPLLRLLAPLTVVSSTLAAQAPTSVGLDTAGMDRDVKPGDAFFEYANGSWLRQDRDSGRSEHLRGERDAHRADRPQGRRSHPRSREAQAPAGSDLRRVADYYAAFLDTSAIETAGLAPLRPTLDSIGAIRDRHGLARFLGSDAARRRRRAEQHQLLHREPVRPVGGAGPGRPARTRRSCSRAALACRTATTTSTPRRRWGTIRGEYRKHVATMLELAGMADAGREAAASSRSRRGIAAGPREPGAVERREQGQQPLGSAMTSAPRRRASTGTAFFDAAGLVAARSSSWSGSPAPWPGSPSWWLSEPLDDLEGLPHLPRDPVTARPSCRRRSTSSRSPSTAPVLSGRQAAARALEAGGRRDQRCARRRGRASCTPSATSRRRRRRGRRRWSRTSSRPSAIASTASTGWRPPPRRSQGQAGGAQGGRRLPGQWPTTPASRSCPAMRSATCERAGLFEYRAAVAARPAGGPRRVGDDAADRQRGATCRR